MAIGNMFQGMARGKVGDVVFAVREGKQVSRVRNRKPKNPQTNKQIMQRAIMATVLQAYSAGKEIFDHSFQGKSVGEQCAREFLSLNTKALRAAIAAEQAAATPLDEQKALVVLPKATKPVVNAYIVSKGSYEQTFCTVGVASGDAVISVPGISGNQTIAQYASIHGLIPGDLYTIVILGNDAWEPSFILNSYTEDDKFATDLGSAKFAYVRLRVKATFPDTAMTSLADVFEVTGSAGVPNILRWWDFVGSQGLQETTTKVGINISALGINTENAVCVGVIRSRTDEDLRSNTTLEPLALGEPEGNTWNTGGIVGGLAVQAWKQRTAQLGDSDLILEGGDV